MDVRVTPISISRLAPTVKGKSSTSAAYQQNRLSSLNTGRNIGPDGTKQNVLITRSNRLNSPQTFSPAKRSSSINNLLLISRKGASKPRIFLNVTPNLNQSINQSPSISGNKKVLLYQQIERNNLLSNNSELVNRFNYKV